MGCQHKNATKSLGLVDCSCCCHCEISMWHCSSKKSLYLWIYNMERESCLVSPLTKAIYICWMLPTAEPCCGDSRAVMRYVALFSVIYDHRPMFCYVVINVISLIFSFTASTAKIHESQQCKLFSGRQCTSDLELNIIRNCSFCSDKLLLPSLPCIYID